MNKLLNEYDITKNMLQNIREYNESNESVQSDKGELANEQDIEDAKTSFIETVSNKVEFESLMIYRNDKNVVFTGRFQDMGGLIWRMILNEDNGLYVDVSGLQLTSETIQTLNSLYGYYKNWSDEWGLKINQDYKPQGDEYKGI